MSRPVQQVDVFTIQDRRAHGKARPFVVRWRIDGRDRTKAFRTRGEADRYRALLVNAVAKGERFGARSGEPESWVPDAGHVAVHAWVRRWLAEQWPEWQPRSQRSVVEAMCRFVPLVVRADAPEPPQAIRAHLKATLGPRTAAVPANECERWLDRHCLQLHELDKEVLARVEHRLGLGDAGQALAAETAGRLRKQAKACIRRAVELDVLPVDPWPPSPKGRSSRKLARKKRAVDVHALPDPATMIRILDGMRTHQPASATYQLMTACVYYAGLRPSEVVMLRPRALELPFAGWGRIHVIESDIDDFGEPGEPKTGRRSVPIPPVLAGMLREWIVRKDRSTDALLFQTRTGRRPAASNWNRSWHGTLTRLGYSGWRIYDCRHAAATTWLASGAPLGEVARRLGHTVDTLVSTYVGALTGDESIANGRIEAALQAVTQEPFAA